MISVSCTGNDTNNDDKVSVFLSVAKALKDVEQAGGPRKILEDPLFKQLPDPLLQVLHGLVNMDDELEKTKSVKDQPRFLRSMLNLGVQSLFKAFTNMILPGTSGGLKTTTLDPELQV